MPGCPFKGLRGQKKDGMLFVGGKKMKEEKSYLGLVLWTIGYMAAVALCIFLPEEWMLRGVMQVTSLGVCALILMIYVNEKVYWINGVTYEEALKAASADRKRFAMRHLKLFGGFAAAYLLFSILSAALHWSEWWDFFVGCIGLIAAAVASSSIKLNEKKTDA